MNKKQLLQNLEQVLQKINDAKQDSNTQKMVEPDDMRVSRIDRNVGQAKDGLQNVIEQIENESLEQDELKTVDVKPLGGIDEEASEDMSKIMAKQYEDTKTPLDGEGN